MGGNTNVINKTTKIETSPAKIPLKEIGRSNFTKKFLTLFKKLNKDFHKETGKFIWVNEKNLESGYQFNGSTSYIFDPTYDDIEIIKYKPTAGDIDLMIPESIAVELWHFLDKIEIFSALSPVHASLFTVHISPHSKRGSHGMVSVRITGRADRLKVIPQVQLILDDSLVHFRTKLFAAIPRRTCIPGTTCMFN